MKSKEQLFSEAKSWIDLIWVDRHGYGGCIMWAFAAAIVLKRAGFKPVIQAGDMQWPIIDMRDDDGVMDTHFSYMWTPNEERSRVALMNGLLPEMHAWVGIVETQEFVDFSTHDFKNQAHKLGLQWRTQDPPQFLWGKLPRYVCYRAHKDATLFAVNRIAVLADELITAKI